MLWSSVLGKASSGELVADCSREDCPPAKGGIPRRLVVSFGATRFVTVALTGPRLTAGSQAFA